MVVSQYPRLFLVAQDELNYALHDKRAVAFARVDTSGNYNAFAVCDLVLGGCKVRYN